MASELFDGVHYYILEKNVKDVVDVKQIMKEGGASKEFYMSELVTHVISDLLVDPESLPVTGHDYVTVNSDWVVMSQKCGAQLPTIPFEASVGKLFSGLVCCPSKLCVSDVEKLCVLLLFHGGKMQRRLDSRVTHLVTMETAGAKYECAKQHAGVKVVSPDWIVDSVEASLRLEERNYHPSNLRPPEMNRHHHHQALNHHQVAMEGCNGALPVEEAVTLHPVGPPSLDSLKNEAMPPEATPPGSRNRATLELQNIATPPRATPVDLENKATPPALECKMVQYETVPQTPGAQISLQPAHHRVEGAGGAGGREQATPIEKRVQATPIERPDEGREQATPTEKRVQATPIERPCGRGEREQATPTKKPSASGGREQATPTITRSERLLDGLIVYFTDYQDCVEPETFEKWRLVIQQHGGQVLNQYDSNRCTHLLALHKKSAYFKQALLEKKCIASAHWLNDVLTEQKLFPPRNPIHFPTAFEWQLPNADICSVTLTNYTDVERELVKDMLRICGLPYTGHLSRENTHLICKRPEGKKYEKALEWGVQVVNGVFLADIIHDGHLPAALLPRYALLNQPSEFDPAMSSEASVILELWKPFMRQYDQQEAGFPGSKKRELTQEKLTTEKDKIRRVANTSPKQSLPPPPPPLTARFPPPVVIFTGMTVSVVKTLNKIVVRLGGVVTDSPKACTHMVTPRIARTIKFLSGVSVCRYVVTPRWVEDSGKAGIFRDEEQFLLRDAPAEKLFGMELSVSLCLAKRQRLLDGMGVYATPAVQPPVAALRDIVGCAGGRVLDLREVRSALAIVGEEGRNDLAPAGVIVLSTDPDIKNGCCKEFTESGIKIYSAELILTGVLKQQLDYAAHTF